jgi:hypothetical protein
VTEIWLKFAVTLFAQAFDTVAEAALAELAGKTKTAAAANASSASTALRRLNSLASVSRFPSLAERGIHRTARSWSARNHTPYLSVPPPGSVSTTVRDGSLSQVEFRHRATVLRQTLDGAWEPQNTSWMT